MIGLMVPSAFGEINITSDGGDCSTVGIWDKESRTCSLTSDIADILVVGANGIIIDGKGHTISHLIQMPEEKGRGIEPCVDINRKIDITIKNFKMNNCVGIFVRDSSDGKITNNEFSNAGGISLNYSNGFLISENSMIGHGNINLGDSDNNIITNNELIRTFHPEYGGNGILLSVSKNNIIEKNIISETWNDVEKFPYGDSRNRSFSNVALFLSANSDHNEIKDNIIEKSGTGVKIESSIKNNFKNNEIINNIREGIVLYTSSMNTPTLNYFEGNTISGNPLGIHVKSSANIFTENLIHENKVGVNFLPPLTSMPSNSKTNLFFNNNFFGNELHVMHGQGNDFFKDTGNYWDDFSDYCDDLNNDQICDEPYPFFGGTSGVIDERVWTIKDGWNSLKTHSELAVEILEKPPAPQKIPEWVKNIFTWFSQDQISEDEVLNAIKFLINRGIIDLNE